VVSVHGERAVSEYVTDTHAFYWHITADPRLSETAGGIFAEADRGVDRIWVPSIILIEMVYLAERGRLATRSVTQIFELLSQPNGSYAVAALNLETARALPLVPRADVADMPDRIIVATAKQLGLPLISRDESIQRAAVVPVIW
jgi:PIN domain nuclease of toxin-antitoxin system